MFTPPPVSKILAIDDDEPLRKSIVDYMEDSGFSMLEANNGKQGLEIFRAEKPDLVLTEIKLPEISGLEVLETINKESPDTPVIVVSKAEGLNDVVEALRRGAWDYLTKPISSLTVLEHAVCKSLEHSRLIEENKIYRQKLEIANQALKKNLDILEQDQEAGRSVQMRLLPEQNMQFGDYAFRHMVAPSLYLSGDFVDYFKISDDKFGFYIADVSGHGAASAFVTILVKGLIEQMVSRYQMHDDQIILEPNNLLARIAKEIHSAKLGKYLTMVYGVIDINDNTLIYSVGGHYPNPVLMVHDDARFLEGKGFPVGIMGSATYQNQTLEFPKKGRLMLFSDGIAEVIPEPDMAEKEKYLLGMIDEGNATIEHIMTRLGLADKKGLPDDVTMLLLSRT